MGVRQTKEYTISDVKKEARMQKIPQDRLFVMDTAVVAHYPTEDTSKKVKAMVKNHLQPAQALYYNSKGELVSFHINCYAHGFRTKWNYFGSFDQFPPETAAPVDSLFTLQDQFRYIKTLDGNSVKWDANSDYIIICYFNRMVRGRNRRLVKEVKKNLELMENSTVEVYYVNNDTFWSTFDVGL